jgi:hypothetical protein
MAKESVVPAAPKSLTTQVAELQTAVVTLAAAIKQDRGMADKRHEEVSKQLKDLTSKVGV